MAKEYPRHEGLPPLLGGEDYRMDVVARLLELGLGIIRVSFRDNDLDEEVQPELVANDVISIGVASIGDRRKLLAVIAAPGTQPPTAAHSAAGALSAPTSAARQSTQNDGI
jgi:hypothetical protein